MTTIEWTDETWNPVAGCAKKTANGVEWAGEINFIPEALAIPFGWKKPRRIFVNSMSDLFHENVPFEWVDQVFAVMALTPQHTFQILTKRPDRMAEYCANRFGDYHTHLGYAAEWACQMASLACDRGWRDFERECDELSSDVVYEELMVAISEGYLPNVWLGTTIENQQAADERIPWLLQTPAALRFLSCEPLLEDLNLPSAFVNIRHQKKQETGVVRMIDLEGKPVNPKRMDYRASIAFDARKPIDWVIVGGESGHGARPCNINHLTSLVEQCRWAQVPVFVKQLGAKPIITIDNAEQPWPISDCKGAIVAEWPRYLQFQEYPPI